MPAQSRESSRRRPRTLWRQARSQRRLDRRPGSTPHDCPRQRRPRQALLDPDESVRPRRPSPRSASTATRDAVPDWSSCSRSGTPHDRRAAAEALGRIGDKSAVPALLAALPRSRRTACCEHSLTYALIEIGDREATAAGLKTRRPRRPSGRAGRPRTDEGRADRRAGRRGAVVRRPVDPRGGVVGGRPAPRVGRRPGRVLPRPLRQAATTPAERDELAGRLAKFARVERHREAPGRAHDRRVRLR